jgi:hypothetical protein
MPEISAVEALSELLRTSGIPAAERAAGEGLELVLESPSPEVGTLIVAGAEDLVGYVGSVTHLHWEGATPTKAAERAAWFIAELLADRVLLYKNGSAGGSCHVDFADQAIPPGSTVFLWSGPAENGA